MNKPITRRADKIDYSMVFHPFEWDDKAFDAMNEEQRRQYAREATLHDTEYREAREWLDQWFACTQQAIATNRKVLLIVGTETYPTQVWSCRKNHYKTICYLEWERKEEDE
jgi:hypothetical protein